MENYFTRIIELFLKSDISTSSQSEFYQWLTEDKFSEEKEKALLNLWDNITEYIPANISDQTQHALNNIYKKIRQREHNINPRLFRFWQISAASFLIALLTALYFMLAKAPSGSDLVEQYVAIAETTHLTLPDGTEVQMNSNSTLLYPEQFLGKSRSVYLVGEANFKVVKNKKRPFVVKSDDFQVTALGTEFNMKAYPGDQTFSATLFSGSVEVRFNNLASSLILKPNEQFSYNKLSKQETISHPDLHAVTAWQKGELIFKSATLEEVIAVLERKYPISFVYTSNTLKDDKYTFRFKDQTPLHEIMDIIAEASGNIKYRIVGSIVYISPS